MAGLIEKVEGSVDTLRQFNRQRVVAALRDLDAASRADLSRATGLSRNTVASIVSELQRDGVLREHDGPATRAGGPGRPPALLRLAPPTALAIAVDVDPGQVRVAVGDATGVVIEERRAGLPPGLPARDQLAAAAALVAEVTVARGLSRHDVAGVAVGLPAPVDRAGRPVTARYRGLDVAACAGVAELSDRVYVHNDADLGALGEAYFGAGRGIDDFVYVKVAEGVGAGLILGGRLYRGSRGLAGDLGHVRVRDDGDVCRCGNRGCLETLVSARALVAALQPAYPGRALTVPDLFDRVSEQDPGARVLVTDAGRAIGRTLAAVVTVLNPAAIVVGGSLSALGEPLLAGVRESIARYGQPIAVTGLRVVRGECGDRAGVLGGLAAALGLSHGSVPAAPAR